MIHMHREKKTGMVEECRQNDGKRALRACTECGILLGYSKATFSQDTPAYEHALSN